MKTGRDLGELGWGPVRHHTDRVFIFPLVPTAIFSFPLYPANRNVGLVSLVTMLPLILRWWIAPLPFTWMYIYIWTDPARDPHSPPEATKDAPKGQCRQKDMMNVTECDFICQIETLVPVLIFYALCLKVAQCVRIMFYYTAMMVIN